MAAYKTGQRVLHLCRPLQTGTILCHDLGTDIIKVHWDTGENETLDRTEVSAVDPRTVMPLQKACAANA
ncbi:MAG: hypothetical protein UV64_C0007G0005 [Parcubacteria group bacterium GW2011_GWC1_43_11b]|nr:MAG: hypothetical protein UV64_C0007G0005 [Parcubacteria group bacterium GW2011_GWC1_43_11b]